MSVNKVILVGNVGKDPETRYIDESTAITKFPLATSEVYKNRAGERVSTTEWHNVVLWRGLAQIAEKYVRKGTQIYIEGRIKTRSYDDADGNRKYITEIVGDQMQLLGRRPDDSEGGIQGGESSMDEGQPSQSRQPSHSGQPSQGQSPVRGEDAARGDTARGDSARGDTARGDSAEGTAPPDDPFDAGDEGPDDLPF